MPRTAKKPHGGKRAGAGRKRGKLPDDVIARLGPPPGSDGAKVDAKALRLWNARLLAEVQWLSMKGEIDVNLAASIRANAGSLDRALPAEPPPTAYDEDDPNDDEDRGPELADTAGDGGLRVG